MKVYKGYRNHAETLVTVNDGDGARPLDLRLDLRNHSPDGFEWGYNGSGPAQLALALLADAIGDDRALELYQRFKFKVIGPLPQEQDWTLTEEQILQHVADLEQEDLLTSEK